MAAQTDLESSVLLENLHMALFAIMNLEVPNAPVKIEDATGANEDAPKKEDGSSGNDYLAVGKGELNVSHAVSKGSHPLPKL